MLASARVQQVLNNMLKIETLLPTENLYEAETSFTYHLPHLRPKLTRTSLMGHNVILSQLIREDKTDPLTNGLYTNPRIYKALINV